MKTIKECFNKINNMLYSQNINHNTLKAKREMSLIINHLSIRETEKLKDTLNKIILLSEQKDTLLTHRGVIKILCNEFPETLLDFAQTEKARRYLE